jgi:hypothetical protein
MPVEPEAEKHYVYVIISSAEYGEVVRAEFVHVDRARADVHASVLNLSGGDTLFYKVYRTELLP